MRKRLKNTLIPHKGNGHVPHIFSHKGFLGALAFLAIVQLSIYAGAVLLPRLNIQLAAVLPSAVTLLTNELRAQSHLPALKENQTIAQAAQAKADDMAAKSYFAHQSPDGTQPWDWIERAGYKYEYAGENLAVNYTDSTEVVRAWSNSPTHHLNLVGPRYTETGVGVSHGTYQGRGAVFVVQMFASPRPVAPVPTTPAPRAVTTQTPAPTQAVATEPQVQSAQVQRVEDTTVLGMLSEELPVVENSATKVLSSPRTYGAYFYAIFAAFLAVLLVIGFTPLIQGRHHPKAALRGAVMVGAVLGLMFINDRALFTPLELPVDSQHAALVINAL